MNFDNIKGLTFTEVNVAKDNTSVLFVAESGERFQMIHDQDCCENVSVEEIIGELQDLIGHEILEAEEVSQEDPNASESGTWTFYKLGTLKGSVTIRWYGASNGYYSEAVSFRRVAHA